MSANEGSGLAFCPRLHGGKRQDLTPLLEAESLHKRFGRQIVLDDVSLAFDEGQLTGIIGPNGAGKTTLFNVLTGRYAPERGRIRFAGRDITGSSPAAIARLGIARSFQAMNLFEPRARSTTSLSPCRRCARGCTTPGRRCDATAR